MKRIRVVSQVVRQPPLKRKSIGTLRERFANNSYTAHYAPVTQLEEEPDLKSGSCRFESCQGYAEMEREYLSHFRKT
jgi:hypothetical protein